jgi:glycosyltransferase involved in cell wall biosynthesis
MKIEKQKLSKNVFFYIFYNQLNVLGPYLYAINIWRERGYKVSIYSLWDEKHDGVIYSGFRKDFFHYCIEFPLGLQALCFFAQIIGGILRKMGVRTRGSEWVNLVKMSYFALYCFFKTNKKSNSILIGTDPAGLWAATLVVKRTKSQYIYSVRELLHSADAKSVMDRVIKRLERNCNRNALFTVEFDETRAELLRIDNDINPERMFIVPNSPPGESNLQKSMYLREKLGIGEVKKIVLYTGGIAEYNLTYEILKTIELWPRDVVLVLHSWGQTQEIKSLKAFACQFNREIYFSTEMVPFNEINKIYASADIGLALYGDQDLNHKYAGLSSGKLFNFMKACVPVITNNTPSCIKAIHETGCGICIESCAEIGKALYDILQNEVRFRLSCNENFSKFEYSRNYGLLIDSIETKLLV